VAAVLEACRAEFTSARRVVEVGAGCGHATRALAGQLSLPVFGIDRDPVLVERARQLVGGDDVSFSVADGESELELCAGDLVVGLHACGGLGEALLRQAAKARAHVLLVSCCLQKIAADPRQPLSAAGQRLGLTLQKSALGLTNLAPFVEIGHAEAVMRGRQARHALRLLLAARGKPVPPGEEARGIHRREFRRGLAAVAGPALAARGLAPASEGELGRFADLARTEHRRMRRWSLPRAMLGRVVELAVVFDRAAFLEERGYRVRVEPLFSRSVSPRNLAVLATS
jgi:protein-L-isoaspartate O-methyltransferase